MELFSKTQGKKLDEERKVIFTQPLTHPMSPVIYLKALSELLLEARFLIYLNQEKHIHSLLRSK